MTELCFNVDRFATRLNRWRRGQPLRYLAEDVGLSHSTLSRLECGGTPDLLTFMTLCRAMREDPREFFYTAEYEGEEV